MNIKSLTVVVATLSLALPSSAHADGNTCVRYAKGVPRISEPPAWADNMDFAKDVSLDDPRWNEAEGKTLGGASATTPMTVKSLWWKSTDATPRQYMYLSFVSDMWTDPTMARDVFLGFHRTDAGAPNIGYIFQFHLDGADNLAATPLAFCPKYDSTFGCTNGAKAWWRVFVDTGATTSCDMLTTARQFKQMGADATSAPWVTANAHAWQNWDAGNVDKRRWAIQLRVPIVAAGSPLTAGIAQNATYWYEATGNPVDPASIARWPLGVTTSVCKKSLDPNNDQLVHAELGDTAKYSALTMLPVNGTDATCDKGLSIDRDHIGSVFDTNSGYDTSTLTRRIKPGGKNTLVAQVHNDAAAFNNKLSARFRIADWGSTAGPAGEWNDVPGQPSPPTATQLSIPANGQKALTFDWTLSKTDVCKYQLNGTPAECLDCQCGPTGSRDCPAGQSGKKSLDNETCVAVRATHQCMYVELDSPNGAVQFSQKSAYNNMDFGMMSDFDQNATIDVSGIDPAPNGTHEVLLFVRPHNMPATLARPTTGIAFMGNNALFEAERITVAHQATLARLAIGDRKKAFALKPKTTATNLKAELRKLGAAKAIGFENARRALSKDVYTDSQRFIALAKEGAANAPTGADAFTRKVVTTLGPRAASKIVPTLEIYPYYKSTKSKTYQPMEAFSVFLSHDGAIGGFKWRLGGANVTKVSEYVYKIVVPNKVTKAQVAVHSETVPAQVPAGPIGLEWSQPWAP